MKLYLTLLGFVLLLVVTPPGMDDARSEVAGRTGDPVRGMRLFLHYCAACHGESGQGNGINSDNLDPHPADLTAPSVDKLSDEEIFETIDLGGAEVGLSPMMPPWGRSLSEAGIHDLVAYVRSLSQASGFELSKTVRFTGIRREGREECEICHRKRERPEPIAPNLGHEGSKLKRAWLLDFLKEPHKVRPIGFIPLTKSVMPNFYLEDAQAEALTAYLMTLKDEGVSARGLGRAALTEEEAAKGEELFFEFYGCDSCHRAGEEKGGIVGPDLSEVPRRLQPEWVFHWLKDPQAIRPDSPMPNFGLSDADARALTAFLFRGEEAGAEPVSTEGPPSDPERVTKGEKLVEQKNCKGCHTLDSYNSKRRQQRAGLQMLLADRSSD